MLLRLVVTEGPLKGEEVIIRDTVVIGRKGTDLNLRDPKASTKHARIFANDEGGATIEDMASSNGTYVNEVKIASWALKSGDVICIGRTFLKVEDQPMEKGLEKGSWQEVIEGAFNKILAQVSEAPPLTHACKPFQEPLVLEITKGLQTGKTFTFGFGPRYVGKNGPDGLLIDNQAPDLAFELHPIKNGLCELRTQSEALEINGKKFKRNTKSRVKLADFREKLEIGDRISFGQTVIMVKAFERL